MKKTKLFLLAAALFMSFNSFSQCVWTVQVGIINLSCNGNCDGKIVIVTDNVPAGTTFTFLWSTGSNTNYIDKVCDGSYTVTITDDKGCSVTQTYTITAPKVLEVTCVASVPTAPGTLTANVTGGTPPYTYSWNTVPVQTTQTITNVAAGNYQVNVVDANGCANSSNCKIDAGTTTCGGRTQTQGGWGAVPNGYNPGTYLHAHFVAAFPTGLTIGCTKTFKLTSAQAVTDFLPSGSTAKALSKSMIDSVAYKNVFAGQLVTATLSVGFDYENANFSPASITLDNQIIQAGPFAGKTVGFLISEANKKIGGCASVYSFSQLNDALDSVNNNYDDGTVNKGYLGCTVKAKMANAVVSENGLSFNVYPNPFSSIANLEFTSAKDSYVTVELFDLTGRMVKSLYAGDTKQDDSKSIVISADELRNGIYLLKIKSDNDVYNQRVFIQK